MLTRRRFVSLCGVTAPGFWLAGAGFFRLPERMIIAISGRCSFCGKGMPDAVLLAGVVGRRWRICHECVDLCVDIIAGDTEAEDPREQPRHAVPAESMAIPSQEGELERLIQRAIDSAGIQAREIDDLLESARKHLDGGTGVPRQGLHTPLACSFCDQSRDAVRKLVAGPCVYICDGCIASAAGLFAHLVRG